MMILWGPGPWGEWNCSVEATSRLPDQRVIFSYAQNFTLQNPKEEDECAPKADETNAAVLGWDAESEHLYI